MKLVFNVVKLIEKRIFRLFVCILSKQTRWESAPDKSPLAEIAFEIGPPLPMKKKPLSSSSVFSSAAAPRFVEVGSP